MSHETTSSTNPPLTPTSDEPVMLPTSFAQELLWLMQHSAPQNTSYNVPRTRRVVGPLDVAALRRAFDALIERHEILRTTYGFHEEQAVQVVHAARPVAFTVVDLSHLPAEQRTAETERLVLEQARRPFDLSQDQLLRVTVIRHGDAEHVLHLDSHHIAFDGWSREILFRELSALYVLRQFALLQNVNQFYKIHGGMDQLPRAMARSLGAIVRYNAALVGIDQSDGAARLEYVERGRAG